MTIRRWQRDAIIRGFASNEGTTYLARRIGVNRKTVQTYYSRLRTGNPIPETPQSHATDYQAEKDRRRITDTGEPSQ